MLFGINPAAGGRTIEFDVAYHEIIATANRYAPTRSRARHHSQADVRAYYSL